MNRSRLTWIHVLKRFFVSNNLKRIELLPFNDSGSYSIENRFKKFDIGYDKFKLILDVRSPDEYKLDHLPKAVNIPILDNKERNDVGKIYDKSNPLSARLLGASLIMHNLSSYLQPGGLLFEALKANIKTDDDQILVYCWRGGQRSKSVALILSEIYINRQSVCILSGGYKAYRRHVIDNLEKLVDKITFIGICGLTGTGKTKILNSLRLLGEVVLDLEELAEHKGSVFGSHLCDLSIEETISFKQLPQKSFDSRLFHRLVDIVNNSDNSRICKNDKIIVWVECESQNIGKIHLAPYIWQRIQKSKRIIIETSIEERVKHILSEYEYWTKDSYANVTQLIIGWLSKHCSKSLINYWKNLVITKKFEELVHSLLMEHYDPIYRRNRQKFIDCTDENAVAKISIESLDNKFLEKCISPELINISKKLLI